MQVSVLIATYKRINILSKTLNSFLELETNAIDWEILIADNADDLKTKNLVESFSLSLPIKYFVEKRRGKNFALNTLLPHAKGQLFVFTDDDIIASPNWLETICEASKKWNSISVFGGKILPDWPEKVDLSMFFEINERLKNCIFCIINHNCEEGVCPIDEIWGPNFVVRRAIFDNGWTFNTNIGPSSGKNYIMGSESEFLIRLGEAGYHAVFLPKSVVHHQIRKEQLTKKWLYSRAFRMGKTSMYNDIMQCVEIFGVPRHLFRQFLSLLLKRVVTFFSFNQSKSLEYALLFWQTFGKIQQSYLNNKTSTK